MSEAEVITVGEKGQVVIPKKMRQDLKIGKGNKILITEQNDKLILKPMKFDEKHIFMLLSETSLKKVWDNRYDERWDNVF